MEKIIKRRILAILIDILSVIIFGLIFYLHIVRLRASGINILPEFEAILLILWLGGLWNFLLNVMAMLIFKYRFTLLGMSIMNIQYKERNKMKFRLFMMNFFFFIWIAVWAVVIVDLNVIGFVLQILMFTVVFNPEFKCPGWDLLSGLREVEIRIKKDSNT